MSKLPQAVQASEISREDSAGKARMLSEHHVSVGQLVAAAVLLLGGIVAAWVSLNGDVRALQERTRDLGEQLGKTQEELKATRNSIESLHQGVEDMSGRGADLEKQLERLRRWLENPKSFPGGPGTMTARSAPANYCKSGTILFMVAPGVPYMETEGGTVAAECAKSRPSEEAVDSFVAKGWLRAWKTSFRTGANSFEYLCWCL